MPIQDFELQSLSIHKNLVLLKSLFDLIEILKKVTQDINKTKSNKNLITLIFVPQTSKLEQVINNFSELG